MCMTCILCIYLGIMVGILFVYLASSCEVYKFCTTDSYNY